MFLQLINVRVKNFDKLVYVTKKRIITKLDNFETPSSLYLVPGEGRIPASTFLRH